MSEKKRPLFCFDEETHIEKKAGRSPLDLAEESLINPRPVVVVDVDIPLSSLFKLFFKLLAVCVPLVCVMGLVLYAVWLLV